jgi:hypothetical protein
MGDAATTVAILTYNRADLLPHDRFR